MKMKMKFWIVAFVLGFALTLPTIIPASAGLSVVGSIYQAEVIPGQHIEHEIKLHIGAEDLPMNLTTSILDLGQNLNGGYTMINADQKKGNFSAQAFLNVSPSKIHIDPGESKNLLISGDVPSNIGDGSRYAMASMRTEPKGSGSVSVALVVNIPILLTISGSQFSRTAEISELDTTNLVNNIENATLTLKNTGNTDFHAMVKAVMKDIHGNPIANSTITQPTLPPILPEKLRKFDLSLKSSKKIEPGNYSLSVTAYLDDGTVLTSKEITLNVKGSK
jgi:hypothetical protein